MEYLVLIICSLPLSAVFPLPVSLSLLLSSCYTFLSLLISLPFSSLLSLSPLFLSPPCFLHHLSHSPFSRLPLSFLTSPTLLSHVSHSPFSPLPRSFLYLFLQASALRVRCEEGGRHCCVLRGPNQVSERERRREREKRWGREGKTTKIT
jgi:hypothetical protein